jgi:hypothetical protein
MNQLDMFGTTTSPTSILGLTVEMPDVCNACGGRLAVIRSSCRPHFGRYTCAGRWISAATYRYLTTVVGTFGRPSKPIRITSNSCTSTDKPADATATPTERKKHMHIDALYPSRFLRCADLNGRPMRVTIAGIKREDLGGESKVVLSFANGEKSLILNKTNARTIAKTLGDETRAWAGKDIVLVPKQVDFKGDLVDAIRVRAARPQQAQTSEEPPFDDDLSDFAA